MGALLPQQSSRPLNTRRLRSWLRFLITSALLTKLTPLISIVRVWVENAYLGAHATFDQDTICYDRQTTPCEYYRYS
jgi:hypothetical protein